MPGEKLPDFRQKLDALAALPAGISFNENAAWERLSAQLPTRSRRPAWLGWAAALVALAGGGWWLAGLESDVRPGAAVVQPAPSPVAVPLLPKKQSPPPVVKTVAEPLKIEQKKKPALLLRHTATKVTTALLLPDPQPLPAPPLADSVRTAVVAKPRFKVAHINELSPVATPTAPERKPALALHWDDRATDDDRLSSETITQARPKRFLSFNRTQK